MHDESPHDDDDFELFPEVEPYDDDPGELSPEDQRDPTRVLAELPQLSAGTIELEKIPPRLWEQTLLEFHPQQRVYIVRQVEDKRMSQAAWALIDKLRSDEYDRRDAADLAHHAARRTGVPLPTPGADHAVVRATVQLNVRLRADDHARVRQAAAVVDMKPRRSHVRSCSTGSRRSCRSMRRRAPRRTVHRRTHGYP